VARNDEARLTLLGRYFDGEATPAEVEAAESILRAEPELAMELGAVQGLGALLKTEVEDVVERVDFTYLSTRVLAEAEARKPLSLWERVEEFFREQVGARLWLPGAVVAAAALAALLLSGEQAPEGGGLTGPRNELVITKVDTDKNWMSQTIDDEGTTILWIDDSQQ
jgi:hypothetical protein